MLWGISSPYAVGRYAFARARGVGGSSASSAYRSQPKCSTTRHGPTSNSALKVLTCHEALILNKNHLQNNQNPNQDDIWRSCRWVQWSKAATRWAGVLRCESFGSQFALRECGHLEKMSLGRSEHLGIIWLLRTSLLAISWDLSILLPAVCSSFSVVGEEWQDKLKYFLAHRPHAFHMDDGEKLTVRLTKENELKDISGYLGWVQHRQTCEFGAFDTHRQSQTLHQSNHQRFCAFLWGGGDCHKFNSCSPKFQLLISLTAAWQESVASFEELRVAVEETILELLRSGKTTRDHKG